MDRLQNKLNRIEGQVRGIKKMYEEGRGCLDIVQQIVATRQALARVGKDLLSSEAVKCSKSARKQKDFDKMIKKLFDVS